MSFDESFWVAIAFVTVLGVFLYYRFPRKLLGMLDKAAADIEDNLTEAKNIRAEAERILDECTEKRRHTEEQVEKILENARTRAEKVVTDTRAAMQVHLARRTAEAERRIARAEEDLIKEIRKHTSEVAIHAAEHILSEDIHDDIDDEMIAENISALSKNLQ